MRVYLLRSTSTFRRRSTWNAHRSLSATHSNSASTFQAVGEGELYNLSTAAPLGKYLAGLGHLLLSRLTFQSQELPAGQEQVGRPPQQLGEWCDGTAGHDVERSRLLLVSRELLRTGTDNSHPILNLKAPNRELQEFSPSLQRLHQRHPQIWAHESHRDTRKASPASDICHPETFRDGIN